MNETEKAPHEQEAAGDGKGKEELEKAQKEAAENYDKYLRALAELENAKRRAEREKSDLRKYGLEGFLRDILPVLDSFDKALGSNPQGGGQKASSEWSSILEGILLVKKQLLEILERHGLAPVDSVGAKFDPNVHQAIQKVESPDAQEEVVKDEYSKGYVLHGRLIRPAMVSVLVPFATPQDS